MIVVTTTDTDKSGASYYGEQGLLYLSARGDGSMVPLSELKCVCVCVCVCVFLEIAEITFATLVSEDLIVSYSPIVG